MYVTRPLSLFKKQPELLSLPPEDAPGSGYLILDDADDIKYASRFSSKKNTKMTLLKDLPLPQNKLLAIETSGSGYGYAFFIPVIDQPLSSNCYYVIVADDNDHEGLAYTSARVDDRKPSCFCASNLPCKGPKELNPHNIDQQFEMFKRSEVSFFTRSPDPDSFPPSMLRSRCKMYASTKNFVIGEARGLNSTLRSLLADFNFPLSHHRSFPLKIGKWYCPFMFVKEGTPREQVERTLFYELKLEQRWERIFTCNKGEDNDSIVSFNVVVPTELVKIYWIDAVSERDEANGVLWFQTMSEMGLPIRIGLSLVIVERMTWEQERAGWVCQNEKQVTVERMKTYKGKGSWKQFGSYMLVEQYVLKRSNGSVVFTYDFNHTHRIRSKWE